MAIPTYTYSENTPQSSDKINTTQPIIQSNFQAIDELIGENHVGFNVDGFGKHTVVEMPVQGAAPTFATDENGFYNLLNATTGKNELYIHKQRQGVAAGESIPFSASVLSNTVTASCTNGWSYLPSGLLVRWGKNTTAVAAATFSIDTATISGGPAFTKALCAIISGYSNSGGTPFYWVQTGLSALGVINGKYSTTITTSQGITYFVIGV